MARIIVDIDKEGLYQFFVRRDSNRTVATSCLFATKGGCMDAIAAFMESAKEPFYWTYGRSPVAAFHRAEWRKNGAIVKSKHYTNLADLNKALLLIKSEISFKTPIFHTIIKNENHGR